jgi:hypothetical protein
MGGIVSQTKAQGASPPEEQYKVVTLDGAHSKLRFYQHALTSEVIVLYDQQIGDWAKAGDESLWHLLKVSRLQGEYFQQLKVNVAVSAKNLNLRSPSQLPSPSVSVPGTPMAPMSSTPIFTSHNNLVSRGEQDKSPEFEEIPDGGDIKMMDIPSKKGGITTRDDFPTEDDEDHDVVTRTAGRLRSIANKRGEYSLDDSNASSNDSNSNRCSSQADPKPTYPTYHEDAKPKAKGVYRKFVPQIYSISHHSSNSGSNSLSFNEHRGGERGHKDPQNDSTNSPRLDMVIEIRSRTASNAGPGTGSGIYYPDEPKESGGSGKLVKRRSSEKSSHSNPDLDNSLGMKSVNSGNAIFNSRTVRCGHCQNSFYGVSSLEAVDEHTATCKVAYEMKERFETLDFTLREVRKVIFVFSHFFLISWFEFYRK